MTDPMKHGDAYTLAMDAARKLIAWFDAEKTGADYGTLTRDTHPQGEKIWQIWWDMQGQYCVDAEASARAALAADARLPQRDKSDD